MNHVLDIITAIITIIAVAGMVCISLGQEWPSKEVKAFLRVVGLILCMLSGLICVCWLVYIAF